MTKISKLAVAGTLALTIALVAGGCSSNSSGASGGGFEGDALTGAGATFPDPIYEQWFKDFQQVEPGAKINYQAIGSGGGVTQFTSKTVDFAASDAPLQAEEIKADVVRANVIYANKLQADQVRGTVYQGRQVKVSDGQGRIRAPEVVASVIYAGEISANTVVADQVYVRELDRR